MSQSQIDAGGAVYHLALQDNLSRNIKKAVAGAVDTVQAARVTIDSHVKSIGRSIEATGQRLATIGAGVAAVGSGATFGLVRATIAAGNFAETLSMFREVFKDQSKAVEQWARVYGKSVGRSKAQLMEFAAEAQDTFVPLGFDREKAADLSKTVTRLAVDLASFKNMSDRDAFDSLMGGVVGITTNLRKFGVIAQEAQIKQKALQLGFDAQNLTPYQKALAILEITLDGTKDAQGDAIRTAGSFNNSVKALGAAIGDLGRALGGPLLNAATSFVRVVTAIVDKVNGLLTAFPMLSQAVGVAAVAMVGIGAAVAAVGLAVKAFGGLLLVTGIAFAGTVLWANGMKGSLGLLTGVVGKTSLAIQTLNATLAGNATAWRGGQAGAVAFRGSLFAIVQAAAAVNGAITKALAKGAWVTLIYGLRKAVAGLLLGFVRAFGVLRGVIGGVLGGAGKLAAALLSPWAALAGVITAAAGAVLLYYKHQQKLAGMKSKALDQERYALLHQSYKDAGQKMPADVTKQIDFNKATVQKSAGPAGPSPLTQEQADLADEINKIRTPIETFRANMKAAAELLDRGKIDQKQFDRYESQQREEFRNSDPATQARTALVDQLRTPLETFRRSIAEARKVFAGDPEMFRRAAEAAREQFMASDKAAQMARNLETPAEAFRRAIDEARKVFANSPEMMKRAMKAARDQFKQASPLEQLKASLQTPAQRFAERLREIREILATAPPALRGDLFKRAAAQARDEFKQNDPAQRFATNVREQIQSEAANIAQQFAKARELVNKGLLTRDQAGQFGAKLLKNAIGDAPEIQTHASFGTSSAMIAANIGAFAPTFDSDREMVEWQKKKAKLQAEIKAELERIRNKRTTFF